MDESFEMLIKSILLIARGAIELSENEEVDDERGMELLERATEYLERVLNLAEKREERREEAKEEIGPVDIGPALKDAAETAKEAEHVTPDLTPQAEVSSGGFEEEIPERPETHLLPEIIERILPYPEEIDASEVKTLLKATDTEKREEWPTLPPEAQKAVVEHLAARARRAKSEDVNVEAAERVIRRLTSYTKKYRPPFCHGLKREHEPIEGRTWLDDVEATANRLDDLIEEYTGERVRDISSGINTDRAVTMMRQTIREGRPEEAADMLENYVSEGIDPEDHRVVSLWLEHREVLREGHPTRTKAEKAAAQEEENSEGWGGTLEEAVQAAEESGYAEVWPSAAKAAQNTWHPNPEKVKEAIDSLLALGKVYAKNDGKIGQSVGQFLLNRGVSHAAKEGPRTMAHHGDARRFRNPETGEMVTVERHVTIGQATDESVQAYFRLDKDKGFVLTYLGEHLPYFTEDS